MYPPPSPIFHTACCFTVILQVLWSTAIQILSWSGCSKLHFGKRNQGQSSYMMLSMVTSHISSWYYVITIPCKFFVLFNCVCVAWGGMEIAGTVNLGFLLSESLLYNITYLFVITFNSFNKYLSLLLFLKLTLTCMCWMHPESVLYTREECLLQFRPESSFFPFAI